MPLIKRGLGAHSLLLWNSYTPLIPLNLLVGLICAHNLCCACVPRFTRMATTICQKLISLKYRRFSELLEVTEQIALFWLVGHFDDLSNNFTHKRSSFGCSCSSFYWLNLLIKHQLFVCWSIWWVLDLVTFCCRWREIRKKSYQKQLLWMSEKSVLFVQQH